MRRERIPEGAEVVTTYGQYEVIVQGFFGALYNLLIVVGRPGLAKSYSFEERISGTSHLIRGWAAPLQAYIDAYFHRNKLLIFDDAEALWKRPGGRVLLRSLCEHRDRKLVQWTSTAPALKKQRVPQSFTTISKVALIANRFVFGGEDEYAAIADRGHLVYFDPSPVEVHLRVGRWFWNQQIFDYIGERLHLIDSISSRLYLKAYERRQAGGDWKRLIEEAYCFDHTTGIVQALEADPACKSVEDRVRKFCEKTGACRATYFNVKRRLADQHQLYALEKYEVPILRLRAQAPPEIDLETEVARAQAENVTPEDRGSDEAIIDPADWWKHPSTAAEETRKPESEARPQGSKGRLLAQLQRELEEAVRREDYERAAELRDEIRRQEKDDKEK